MASKSYKHFPQNRANNSVFVTPPFETTTDPIHHLQYNELPVSVRAPGAASENRHRRLSCQFDGAPAIIGGERGSPPLVVPIALLLRLGRRVVLLLVPRQL